MKNPSPDNSIVIHKVEFPIDEFLKDQTLVNVGIDEWDNNKEILLSCLGGELKAVNKDNNVIISISVRDLFRILMVTINEPITESIRKSLNLAALNLIDPGEKFKEYIRTQLCPPLFMPQLSKYQRCDEANIHTHIVIGPLSKITKLKNIIDSWHTRRKSLYDEMQQFQGLDLYEIAKFYKSQNPSFPGFAKLETFSFIKQKIDARISGNDHKQDTIFVEIGVRNWNSDKNALVTQLGGILVTIVDGNNAVIYMKQTDINKETTKQILELKTLYLVGPVEDIERNISQVCNLPLLVQPDITSESRGKYIEVCLIIGPDDAIDKLAKQKNIFYKSTLSNVSSESSIPSVSNIPKSGERNFVLSFR